MDVIHLANPHLAAGFAGLAAIQAICEAAYLTGACGDLPDIVLVLGQLIFLLEYAMLMSAMSRSVIGPVYEAARTKPSR